MAHTVYLLRYQGSVIFMGSLGACLDALSNETKAMPVAMLMRQGWRIDPARPGAMKSALNGLGGAA